MPAPLPPVLERTVVGPVATVRVRSTVGEPAAPVYVLVHGIGMSHRYFSRLHRMLAAEGATVHAVDLPGFGGVPRPRHDLDIAGMVDVLADALDACGVAPAIVVGQSMGAQWATELAVRHPGRVRALALIGPVADERHRTPVRQAIGLAMDTLREPPATNALVLTDYLRCPPPWYLRQLREMLAYPLEDRVRALSVPVLVLRGGRDPIAGAAWADRIRAAATVGMRATVPGHAHNVQHSAPRAVAGALRSFVSGLP